MQRFLTSLALTFALGLSAGRATALGFGETTSSPVMGQPLSFVIGLRFDTSDTLEAKCVKAEVSMGERALPDSLVRTRIETATTSGERRLRVTTTVPVDEPVVNVALHLGCPSSLSRNFLAFADPPLRGARASSNEAAEDNWTSDRPESSVASVLAAVPPIAQQPAASASASSPVTRRARKRRSEALASDAPSRSELVVSPRLAAPDASAKPRVRNPAPAKPSRGPVLRLDPVEVDSMISPSLQMATSLSQVAGAASGAVPRFMDPEQEQHFREQERLKAMEAALLKLRADSQATQKTLTDMQLRVRSAEASRYANPLVYLLAALCLVLAAGMAAMWWLRRRDRRTAAWWTAPTDEANLPSSPSPSTVIDNPPAIKPAPPPPPESSPTPWSAPMTPAFAVSTSATMPAPARVRPVESDAVIAEPRRPMSAEELIDLEQQAEFFVVLGQDDAAIDLLMGHVRSTGGVSPLPYLKLLEIYRRRGEREPYDRIRERFNRRFNAYAPEWDVDPENGLSLEGYPEVMSRLQRAWARPSQAMELLDASLFRRDAGPTFDVPAYRELLFLYGMSRDLAERDTGPDGVDLLLPFGDSSAESTLTNVAASRPPEESSGQASFSLDLDVSTDRPPLLSLDDDPHFKRSKR
ncbi:MAG: hypothetical protein ABI605_14710 [Rhizobacter sp.]